MITDIYGNRFTKFGIYQLKLDKEEIMYVRNYEGEWEKLTTNPASQKIDK